jgi:hypothetical protein
MSNTTYPLDPDEKASHRKCRPIDERVAIDEPMAAFVKINVPLTLLSRGKLVATQLCSDRIPNSESKQAKWHRTMTRTEYGQQTSQYSSSYTCMAAASIQQ